MRPDLVEGFRMSPQQRHVWAQLRSAGNADVYRTTVAFVISGPCTADRLQEAALRVVDRFEILRTTFGMLPGLDEPVQVVGPARIEWETSPGVSGVSGEVALAAAFDRLQMRAIDLENGPIVHAAVLSLAPAQHALVLTMPALCVDRASVVRLGHEVLHALSGDDERSGAGDVMQYADYAEWQQQLTTGEEAKTALSALRRACGSRPANEASADASTEDGRPPVIRSIATKIDAHLARRLREMTDAAQVSIADGVLACWTIQLAGVGGHADIEIGLACDGRAQAELAAAVGLFSKYLPLTLQVDSSVAFEPLLRQIASAKRELLALQDYFTWQEQTASPSRELPFTWCFDDDTRPRSLTHGDLRCEIRRDLTWAEPARIELACVDDGDALSLRITCDTRHVSIVEAERLAARLQCVLTNVVAEPERSIAELAVDQEWDDARRFWTETLADVSAPTTMALPAPPRRQRLDDDLHPQQQPQQRQQRTLSRDVSDRLRTFVHAHDLTLNTLVHGAWALVLSQYSGAETVMFGTAIAGQPAAVDAVPLKIRVSPEMTVRAWLGGVQARQVRASACGHVPLSRIQACSTVPRGTPLFETILTLDGDAPLTHPRYAVAVTLAMRLEEEITIAISHDATRFAADGIAWILAQFEQALIELSADPRRRLVDVPVLSPTAERQVLLDWNATARPYSSDRCLHHLIEAQVERTPDAVALVSGSVEVTYRDLNARANRVAHSLRALGVGVEASIAVSMSRSVDMVVALLGVMKADGAYVPLEPDLPPARRAAILADTAAPVILTQARWRETFAEQTATVLCLDDPGAPDTGIETAGDANPISRGGPDHAIYVLYTSGSTGVPKGVTNVHRGLVNRLEWMRDEYGIAPGDRILQKTPYTFDVSAWELFLPLISGATMVIAGPEDHKDATALVRVIREARVTAVHFVPSMLAAFLETSGVETLESLRYVFASGEALEHDVMETCRARLACPLVNLYGPTEAAIDVTVWACAEAAPHDTVPIGRPIANTRIYVVDRHFRPVPPGAPGELCIGGIGLARGYCHRPGQTAERFVPDPFGEAGDRLYRTGDLARYADDGVIEFLGRADAQVKIRGFRIELGEIEAALRALPQVREAAVVVAPGPHAPRLLAFVVPHAPVSSRTLTDQVRPQLAATLPDYMVPSRIVSVDAVPRTTSGKVDRARLLAMPLAGVDAGDYVPPETGLEQRLAAVWQEVLHVERVGRHDNFFELGGDSLSAMQLASRMRSAFAVDVPLRRIFERRTLIELAAEVLSLLGDTARAQAMPMQAVPTARAGRESRVTLSFAQQRLWFLSKLEPEAAAYNVAGAVRVRGVLREQAFIRALDALVQRHESLRTTFIDIDGVAFQQIAGGGRAEFSIINPQSEPEPQRLTTALRTASEITQQTFDLQRGPLLRAWLLPLAADDALIVLATHHIVSDGWSMAVLIDELAALYSAFSAGRPSPLPELPVQYPDFAIWQREWLTGDVLDRQLAYWMDRLAGVPEELTFPTDKPRPPIQTFKGARERFEVSPALSAAVRSFCRAENATMYMVLLAAFKVLLHRHSGQEDVVVGVPTANRRWKDTESLIGFFANTLVMRTEVSPRITFRELLERVREGSLGAHAHQDVPFEKLVEALQPVRDLSRHPLFQFMFAYQNTPAARLEVEGLIFERVDLERPVVQFDWNVAFEEVGDRIIGTWQYNTDIFEANTIRRLIAQFQCVLTSAIAEPERAIAELAILPPAERTRLLETWTATAAAFPREQTVHGLVEAQVARTPAAIAVRTATEAVTYAALNEDANRLAHHLRAQGVRADMPVGLCVERSVAMVVGQLAILKAGGAYVPLEPSWPAERLSRLIADGGLHVVVTTTAASEHLPASVRAIRLDAPEGAAAIARQPAGNGAAAVDPAQVAYVLYTSGSTGQPKGVMVPHRALVNHMTWMQTSLPLTAADRVLQKTPFSFDASVWEFYAPLMVGAELVLAAPGGHQDPRYIVETMAAEGITRLQVVPALLAALADEPGLSRCTALRVLCCGGEALPAPLVSRVWAALDDVAVVNLYGPTEVTIDATAWTCARDAVGSRVPIGRPIHNLRAYVVDETLAPVPIGVEGELYLAGAGVARGYLRQPGLTADRFGPDPFAAAPGARWYRTGDRARWTAEGVLEYLGRRDQQVKVRGMRIELGEIEAALRQHPEVRDAAVTVREATAGGPLVAYVIAARDATPRPTELRAHLMQHVPDSMLPHTIVLVDTLPRISNGKLDRRALETLDVIRSTPEPGSAAASADTPRTGIEALLVEIWQDVLHLDRVGIHDNFFELGGDSIISIQIVARATQRGLKLRVREMFQHQTVAELARVVEHAAQRKGPEPAAITGAFALSPIQRQFFELEPPNVHYFNQAVMLETDLPFHSVDTLTASLVAHHDALRLRFTRAADGWTQHYADRETHRLTSWIDLSAIPQADRARELARHAHALQASLHITRGPLLRAAFFTFGDGRPRLLIVIHHLAIDGVSWRILLEDLERGWSQLGQQVSPRLPAKTASFREHVDALAAYAASDAVRQETAYWLDDRRRTIAPLPAGPLLADPHSATSDTSARTLSMAVDADDTQRLLRDVPRNYRVRVQEVLLAALVRGLSEWSGQSRMLIEIEGHGREDAIDLDVSRTVGWFTTSYPLLLDLPAPEDRAAVIAAVKEQMRAVPHNGIGYGVLRYLGQAHDVREALSALPPAEVSFNYLGQYDPREGGPLRLASEAAGRPDPGDVPHRQHLRVIARIVARQLHVTLTFETARYAEPAIERLWTRFGEHLRDLLDHCCTTAPTLTRGEVPLAALTPIELESLVARYPTVEDVYPLTPVQQGLLFHNLFAPEAGFYVEQISMRLRGLHVRAFRDAWRQVLQRHAILRTAFVSEGLAEPMQVVSREVVAEWDERDWRALDDTVRHQELRTFLDVDRVRGFDFAAPPLVRFALMRVTDDEHEFVWTHHHVLLDGWSVPRVLEEVSLLYQAGREARSLELPDPPRFRDYVAWLAAGDDRQAEAFWRGRLRGYRHALPLPVEPLEEADSTAKHFEECRRRFDAPMTSRLRAFASERQVTLNTVMQGAWALLLHRYTHEHTIVIGVTVSGRPPDLQGVEQMIGPFINVVPLRVDIGATQTVGAWLSALQDANVDIRQFEHTPLAKIHAWSELPAGTPLFETLLTFQNYPVAETLGDEAAATGVVGSRLRSFEWAHYPLSLRVAPDAEMLLRLSYDRRRLDATVADRMLGHVQTVLEHFMADPAALVVDVEIMSEAEREVLVAWGEPGRLERPSA